MATLLYKDLSYQIQGAFYQVYKILGNAFKESVYHNALIEEMRIRNLVFETQKRINIYYESKKVGIYCPDLIIEDQIIIEIKAKFLLTDLDRQQFWQYLKGSNYKVGYLVNFGSLRKVELIRRVYDTARKPSRSLA